jgi:chemotaxis protein methyltransferase CheR
MTDQDFDAIRKLLKESSAIVLDDGKQYLVESRLAPLLRQRKLASIGELAALLRRQGDQELRQRIVEAMVTTETSFFRDHHPFEALRKVVIPNLIQRRHKERRLHIWCAACSHGQEPYSIAMLVRDHFPELASCGSFTRRFAAWSSSIRSTWPRLGRRCRAWT